MKRLQRTLLFFAALCASHAALADQPVNDAAARLFDSIDANGDGWISKREVKLFQQSVFYSMDTDENYSVSLDEFLTWDTGWVYAAGEKAGAVDTVKTDIYSQWDQNSDHRLLEGEHRQAILHQFRFANADEDHKVSRTEFQDNFVFAEELRKILGE